MTQVGGWVGGQQLRVLYTMTTTTGYARHERENRITELSESENEKVDTTGADGGIENVDICILAYCVLLYWLPFWKLGYWPILCQFFSKV